MASNPYVNKVQLADGTTVIDISDSTAAASDVAQGKYFYTAAGEKVQGTATGGGAIVVTTETDVGGGTITHINAVDISNDTVDASHLLSGYTAHDSTGQAITGTYVAPTISLQSKTKTYTPTTSQQTETVTADAGYTGLSQVAVTVNAIPSAYKDVTGVTATAGDVVSGKSFVNSSGTVNGSLVISHYYTGSSAPSSSLGVDGDIYLQT